jgi:hypothetical protein
MDVLLIDGADLGFGPPGGDPGLPGLPGDPDGRTEGGAGQTDPAGSDSGSEPNADDPQLPPVPGMVIDLPPTDNIPGENSDLADALNKITKDADKRSKTPDAKPTNPAKGGTGVKGASGPAKGTGGQGGTGGMGKGSKPGPGPGGGIGRKATEQEIKAWRWRFDLTGGPKEHADKLDKAGLMVAVPDREGKANPKTSTHLFISDLKRRPVTLERGDFTRFDEAVKWYNTKADSVRGLKEELKLPFLPDYVVLLLPKDREAKMAAEELRFAKQHNNDPTKVTETWFDFRLQNGVYEPIATKQK